MNILKGKFFITALLLISLFVASDAEAKRVLQNYRGLDYTVQDAERPYLAGATTYSEQDCPTGYEFGEYIDATFNTEVIPGGIHYGEGSMYTCTRKSDTNLIINLVTASLTANPVTINPGEASTLTWNSTNADSCSGTGFLAGGATTGNVSVSPNALTTYSVTCTGATGSANDTAQVNISTGVDLVPARPSLNSGTLLGVGSRITFKSLVTNTKGGNVTKSIPSLFELDINNDGTYDLILSANSLSGINGGQSKSINSSSWTTILGTHAVRAVVDVNTPAGNYPSNYSGNLYTQTPYLCPSQDSVRLCGPFCTPEFDDVGRQDPKILCSPVNMTLIATKYSISFGETANISISEPRRLDLCTTGQREIRPLLSGIPSVTVSPKITTTYSLSCPDGYGGTYSSVATVNVGSGQGGNYTSISFKGTISETNELNNSSPNYVFTVSIPQCSDGIDNDNDGDLDYPADKDCSSGTDLREGALTQCSDGIDNDGDGTTDLLDSGCSSINDNNESDDPAATPLVDISVSTTLVRKGTKVTVSWTASDVNSCSVNGPSLSRSYSTAEVNDQTEVEINSKNTYTITCATALGTVSDNVTVRIVPSFTEE